MRLTVHVTGAKKTSEQVTTKDGNRKTVKRTYNTLSFPGVTEADKSSILTYIKDNGLGTPVRHYFSNEKTTGRATIKKK